MRKQVLLATAAAMIIVPAALAQTQTNQGNQTPQAQAPTETRSGAEVRTAQEFVTQTGMAELFEIQAARLATERAENDEVRQFAERLMEDHGQSAEDLAAAAREAGVDVAIVDALDMPAAPGATGRLGITGSIGTGEQATEQSGTTTGQSAGSGTAAQTGEVATRPAAAAASDELDQERRTKLDELRAASGAEFDRMFLEMQIEAHEEAIAMFERYSEQGDEGALQQHAEQSLSVLRSHLEEAERLMQEIEG